MRRLLALAALLPAFAFAQAEPPPAIPANGTGTIAITVPTVTATVASGSSAFLMKSGAKLCFDSASSCTATATLSSSLITFSVGLVAPSLTSASGAALTVQGQVAAGSGPGITFKNSASLNANEPAFSFLHGSAHLLDINTTFGAGHIIATSPSTPGFFISESTHGTSAMFRMAGGGGEVLYTAGNAGITTQLLGPTGSELTITTTLLSTPSGVAISAASTKNAGTLVLSGGSATATVTAGAHCVCSNISTATVCKPSLSSTTLTVTSGAGTDSVNYICL